MCRAKHEGGRRCGDDTYDALTKRREAARRRRDWNRQRGNTDKADSAEAEYSRIGWELFGVRTRDALSASSSISDQLEIIARAIDTWQADADARGPIEWYQHWVREYQGAVIELVASSDDPERPRVAMPHDAWVKLGYVPMEDATKWTSGRHTLISSTQVSPGPDAHIDVRPFSIAETNHRVEYAKLYRLGVRVARARGIETTTEEEPLHTGGYWSPELGELALNRLYNENGKGATLVHELAHAIDIPDQSSPNAAFGFESYATAEVVAETAALILSSKAGVDRTLLSMWYVSGWLDGQTLADMDVHDRVSRVLTEFGDGLTQK